LVEAEAAVLLGDGHAIDVDLREAIDDAIRDAGVAVDLHVIDVLVGELPHLGGRLVGGLLLVHRQCGVGEEQIPFEFAVEEGLREADIAPGDQLFHVLFLLFDLLCGQRHGTVSGRRGRDCYCRETHPGFKPRPGPPPLE
jgi:hypothetical protein